jgi:hypothetical protein
MTIDVERAGGLYMVAEGEVNALYTDIETGKQFHVRRCGPFVGFCMH